MALVASRNRKEAIVAKTGFPIRPIKNWIAFQLLLKSYYRFARNCKGPTEMSLAPFIQFMPLVTSCIITIQMQNQESDIGTMPLYIVMCFITFSFV